MSNQPLNLPSVRGHLRVQPLSSRDPGARTGALLPCLLTTCLLACSAPDAPLFGAESGPDATSNEDGARIEPDALPALHETSLPWEAGAGDVGDEEGGAKSDTGPPEEGGAPIDGGPKSDSGLAGEGGAPIDGGPKSDTGPPEGGAPIDGGPKSDSGPPRDGGAGPSELSASNLVYQGAFRLPQFEWAGFAGQDRGLAYHAARDSLYVVDGNQYVGEVKIPKLVNSNRVSDLNTATLLQYADPTEGNWSGIDGATQSGIKLGGLLVHGGRLYGNAFAYYDNDGGSGAEQTRSAFYRSLDLSATSSFRGMYAVANPSGLKAGFFSGYMAQVPSEWQAALGGSANAPVALIGQCCIPRMSRTSYGPSLFTFVPSQLGQVSSTMATPLLYYPESHQTLGRWEDTVLRDGSGPVFNGVSGAAGVVLPKGSRTVLFMGSAGIGDFCYGVSVDDPAKASSKARIAQWIAAFRKDGAGDGLLSCYDPANGEHGPHAYPNVNYVWAYDLDDLLNAKAAGKAPWDVRPSRTWSFDLPFTVSDPSVSGKVAAVAKPGGGMMTSSVSGVAYDETTGRIFISVSMADAENNYRPLIHVYKVVLP